MKTACAQLRTRVFMPGGGGGMDAVFCITVGSGGLCSAAPRTVAGLVIPTSTGLVRTCDSSMQILSLLSQASNPPSARATTGAQPVLSRRDAASRQRAPLGALYQIRADLLRAARTCLLSNVSADLGWPWQTSAEAVETALSYSFNASCPGCYEP